MPTPKEYRQQAEDCMNLASEAEELYVRTALIEMAADLRLLKKLGQREVGSIWAYAQRGVRPP
jgi:hypothetical protein